MVLSIAKIGVAHAELGDPAGGGAVSYYADGGDHGGGVGFGWWVEYGGWDAGHPRGSPVGWGGNVGVASLFACLGLCGGQFRDGGKGCGHTMPAPGWFWGPHIRR